MTPRMLVDAIQLAGLLLIVVGAGLLWGWPVAMIVAGAALVLFPLIDALLVRR